MPSSRRPSTSTTTRDNTHDNNDDDSDQGGSGAGDDKDDVRRGRGSSQARKAQNRVAQREFRIRRQQYIRDLEARVEVLSSDKEEKTELTMLLIKNLLKENKDLRMLLKTMAGFIGEGLGSCLPRLGLSSAGLDAILNRADTDTAYEAFVNLKASKELAEANPGIELGEIRRTSTTKRKRGSVDHARGAGAGAGATAEPELPHRDSGTPEIHSGPSTGPGTSQPANDPKRVKSEFGDALQMGPSDYSYDYLFPNLDQLATQPLRQSPSDAWNYMGAWSNPGYMNSPRAYGDNMRGPFPPFTQGYPMQPPSDTFGGANMSGFGLTIPGTTYGPVPPPPPGMPVEMTSSNSGGGASGGVPPGPGPGQGQPDGRGEFNGPNWFMHQENQSPADKTRILKEAVQRMSVSRQSTTAGPLMSAEEVEERRKIQGEVLASMENSSVMQCFQLITYHLNNFRGNHAYVLPPSLRPTVIQRTIPHEHVIDGCLFPTIRDRMILLRGRYDLVGAITGILVSWTQHGDDPLDHRNWEASEQWLNDFNLLADEEVYATVNKWRQHRGAPILVRPDRGLGLNSANELTVKA